MNLVALAHKLLALRLFTRREDINSKFEIIKWWELRRIPFNFVVGITGIFTCAILFVVAAVASATLGEPLGLPGSPLFGLVIILAYAIVANVCFTGGSITEIIVSKVWGEKAGAFAQISFSLGVLFSMLLTMMPAALAVVVLIFRLTFH